MIRLCAVLIFLFPTFVRADGPPIDSQGNPTTPCLKLEISNIQRKDIGTKRIVTLTKLQMKLIAPSWETISNGIISEECKFTFLPVSPLTAQSQWMNK